MKDFPDGGANPQGLGAKLLFGQKFPQKLHENEKNGPMGRVPGAPLTSTNEDKHS